MLNVEDLDCLYASLDHFTAPDLLDDFKVLFFFWDNCELTKCPSFDWKTDSHEDNR